jgi:AcrR family transcriptional regulator
MSIESHLQSDGYHLAMTELTESRRDRKRLANRHSIRTTALRLFMDRGFDNVSVEDIAEAADLSASTVYRNFPTKEDLVLANLADRQAGLLDILESHPGGGTVGDALLDVIVEWAPGRDQQALLRSEIALIVATPALLARMHQMVVGWEAPITACLGPRCGRSETDLELCQLTALLCATVRIVIREWAAGNTSDDIVDFGRRAVEALQHLPAAELPFT